MVYNIITLGLEKCFYQYLSSNFHVHALSNNLVVVDAINVFNNNLIIIDIHRGLLQQHLQFTEFINTVKSIIFVCETYLLDFIKFCGGLKKTQYFRCISTGIHAYFDFLVHAFWYVFFLVHIHEQQQKNNLNQGPPKK